MVQGSVKLWCALKYSVLFSIFDPPMFAKYCYIRASRLCISCSLVSSIPGGFDTIGGRRQNLLSARPHLLLIIFIFYHCPLFPCRVDKINSIWRGAKRISKDKGTLIIGALKTCFRVIVFLQHFSGDMQWNG